MVVITIDTLADADLVVVENERRAAGGNGLIA
jgi:hypothetical protein